MKKLLRQKALNELETLGQHTPNGKSYLATIFRNTAEELTLSYVSWGKDESPPFPKLLSYPLLCSGGPGKAETLN
jgi:hypothetical protein